MIQQAVDSMVRVKGDGDRRKSCPSSSGPSYLSISHVGFDVSTGVDVYELEKDDELGIIEMGIPLIPVDLFVRKKKHQRLTFTDAFNNIVFQAVAGRVSGGSRGCLLLDSFDHPLLSILTCHDGNWRAFKGDFLLFTVEITLNMFGRIELNVLPSDQNGADSSSLVFKMRGSVFFFGDRSVSMKVKP